jgi:hypothetical protein
MKLAGHIDRAHERWRDPVLTALTILLALMMFVLAPLEASGTIGIASTGIAVSLLMAVGLLVISRSYLPVLAILLVIGLGGASLLLRLHGHHAVLDVYLKAASWLAISLVLVWVVGRAVFAPGVVTYHRVIGAVLLYLAIGIVFVALFTLIGLSDAKAFSGLSVKDNDSLLSELIYFSFVTLTTVGYGDILPVDPFARSLCNVEAIFGQLYPATLLARLVTLEVASRQ